MSEMVERLLHVFFDARDKYDTGEYDSEMIVRALIRAMREPTEAMIRAGYSEVGQDTDLEQVAAAWRAMIDEAK